MKKDTLQDAGKKKKTQKVKVIRPIVGMSLEQLKEKRKQGALAKAKEATKKVKVTRDKKADRVERVSKQGVKGVKAKVKATSR